MLQNVCREGEKLKKKKQGNVRKDMAGLSHPGGSRPGIEDRLHNAGVNFQKGDSRYTQEVVRSGRLLRGLPRWRKKESLETKHSSPWGGKKRARSMPRNSALKKHKRGGGGKK